MTPAFLAAPLVWLVPVIGENVGGEGQAAPGRSLCPAKVENVIGNKRIVNKEVLRGVKNGWGAFFDTLCCVMGDLGSGLDLWGIVRKKVVALWEG